MKIRIVAWLVAFLVIFNLGYVFHEIVVEGVLAGTLIAMVFSRMSRTQIAR